MDYSVIGTAGAFPPVKREEPFQFSGSGSEYFRIWAVNSLLVILTLGIYSAWAKVRRNRYLYGNARVAGASFDYHGNPVSILKGRLVAVALLGAYHVAGQAYPRIAAVMFLLLAAAMPWLLWKSLQFRLYNSSYRGIRFGFRGSAGGAYISYLLWPLLAVMSAYLLAPLAHQRIKRFQHTESRFGASRFSFDAGPGGFYRVYLKLFGMVVLLAIAMGASVVFMLKSQGGRSSPGFGFFMPLFAVFYACLFALYPVFTAMIENLVWNHTRLDEHRFICDMSAKRVAWISFTNLLGIVFTLGLFIPFAKIRMIRYRIESMAIIPEGSLDAFLSDAQASASATGEGMADLLDFDLSL
jgi:uncharacterized membrane protein YjgN (DUF898 family)